MGRPTILESDPAKVEQFLELVRGGISPSNACAEFDLEMRTVERWEQRGREAEAKLAEGYELTDNEQLYWKFCRDIQRARKRRILRLEQTLLAKLREDGASARDVMAALARIDPANWSDNERRIRVEHAGSIDTSGEGSRLATKIDEYEAAFAALDDAGSSDDDGDQ